MDKIDRDGTVVPNTESPQERFEREVLLVRNTIQQGLRDPSKWRDPNWFLDADLAIDNLSQLSARLGYDISSLLHIIAGADGAFPSQNTDETLIIPPDKE